MADAKVTPDPANPSGHASLPTPPDPADQDRLFPPSTDPPPDATFEIGLVLGGTVSAGAYTAGALDFLIEALDAWHEGDGAAPPHRVQLKVAGGSSGGAVCTAILSLLANRSFTHVNLPQSRLVDPATGIDNRLWNLWVDAFDFAKLVDTADLSGPAIDEGTGDTNDDKQHVPALLNCAMIDEASAALVAYGKQDPTKDRSWISKPLRIAITVANLRGIPYKIVDIPIYGSYTGSAFVQHDDYAWFAVPTWLASDGARERASMKRPDEFWLARVPQEGLSVGYDVLAAWATASGAMPVGLKARSLQRPAEHYAYRPYVRPITDPATGATTAHVDWPQPDWSEIAEVLQGAQYGFSAVDGGTFNNDPVRLVHRALAGLIGKNPRGSEDARRAMLMIDPLVDEPAPLTKTGVSLVSVAKSVIGAAVGAARYLTADMELFADQSVFSRFQLVPFREVDGERRVGEAALAGTGLFALGGWCCRAFRVHDFLLGRANMKAYLESEFILRADNPTFDKWTPGQREDFALDASGKRTAIAASTPRASYFLPAIPLRPELTAEIPAWPNGALDPAVIKDPVKRRIKAVADTLREDNLAGFGPWLLSLIAIPNLADALASGLVDSFTADLQRAHLWPAKPVA